MDSEVKLYILEDEKVSYEQGFEDAVELCIAETEDAGAKEDAVKKMNDLLVLVKENKFARIKRMLWRVSN